MYDFVNSGYTTVVLTAIFNACFGTNPYGSSAEGMRARMVSL